MGSEITGFRKHLVEECNLKLENVLLMFKKISSHAPPPSVLSVQPWKHSCGLLLRLGGDGDNKQISWHWGKRERMLAETVALMGGGGKCCVLQ